jgi:hypothetical protein
VVVVDYVELMVESFEANVNPYLVNNQQLTKGVVVLVLVKNNHGKRWCYVEVVENNEK